MSSSAQRKRRTTGSPLVSGPSTKTSRAPNTRKTSDREASRTANARRTSDDSASPTETIDVMDNTEDDVMCSGVEEVEEVVDLTADGSEGAVVDLTTNNDSVLVLRTGDFLQERVTSSAATKTTTPRRLSTPPPCLLDTVPGRFRGRSAVPSVWTRTLRSLRAVDWLSPQNVVTCSVVSV
ncbi:E3 ubiquitin-protein ligase RNF4 isoform X4 [Embiotoca jacksoni]|uniref:E3 ubiquitin-protein ligase RNF4 isoform X4 n=1 Tax=Embiotoca jacksoni TaxID=100190 RepID=UPI0037041CEF